MTIPNAEAAVLKLQDLFKEPKRVQGEIDYLEHQLDEKRQSLNLELHGAMSAEEELGHPLMPVVIAALNSQTATVEEILDGATTALTRLLAIETAGTEFLIVRRDLKPDHGNPRDVFRFYAFFGITTGAPIKITFKKPKAAMFSADMAERMMVKSVRLPFKDDKLSHGTDYEDRPTIVRASEIPREWGLYSGLTSALANETDKKFCQVAVGAEEINAFLTDRKRNGNQVLSAARRAVTLGRTELVG